MNSTTQNIKELTTYIKKVSTNYDKNSSLTDILNNSVLSNIFFLSKGEYDSQK